MVNWEGDLKNHIIKKIKKSTGEDIDGDSIVLFETDCGNFIELPTSGLINAYVFSLMKENFEQSKEILDELSNRDCEVNIVFDNKNQKGEVIVYEKTKKDTPHIKIPLKVFPDGIVIDFDAYDFIELINK